MALSLLDRTIGLIGRDQTTSSLLIRNCSAVHTCFMRAPIDIIFLDQAGLIVSVRERVPPWRVQIGPWKATDVLELPAGHAHEVGLAVGDFAVFG